MRKDNSLSDIYTKVILIAVLMFFITVAPIAVETIQDEGGDAPFLLQIVLFPFMILFLVLAIFCAIYFSFIYPDMDFSSVEGDFAEPHALAWAAIVALLIIARYINLAALTQSFGEHMIGIYSTWKIRDQLDDDLPYSRDGRTKEVRRQELAAELEETLAEQEKLKARVKARLKARTEARSKKS